MSDVSVPMGNEVGGDFSGETVSEDGQDQGGQEETQAQAQQRYKLKVNGKEVEKSIDELIRDAQKGVAADEKFQQAASMAKKYSAYEQMEKALASGNVNVLVEKLGHDKFREFAENYLIDYLEYQQLPPDKKEMLEYRRKAEELQSRLDETERGEKERSQTVARQQAIDEIDQEISQVLKASGKKPTPYFVARIAENMLASLQSRDADPRTVAKSAYDRALASIEGDVSEYLGSMSPDEARKVLPKNLLDALRRSDVEAVRSQDPMRSRTQPSKQATTHKAGEKVRMSTDEFFKQRIEKMIK